MTQAQAPVAILLPMLLIVALTFVAFVKMAIERAAEGVEDDLLAPYLAILIAASTGRPMPDEAELGRLYGSASPSRVRRLLDHLERQGRIVVREDFGGERRMHAARPRGGKGSQGPFTRWRERWTG